MIARFARWQAVAITARSLRLGVTAEEAAGALARAYRGHDSAWRQDILDRAVERNARRRGKAIGA